jgi:shikimate kinase
MGHIWLIGMMGTGKSTSGRILGELLGIPFVDADQLLGERAAAGVPEIFASEGEAGFRERERNIIAEIAAGPEAVVAAGGGAALDPGNTALMRATGTIVLLEATPAELVLRLSDPAGRPLLSGDDLEERVTQLSVMRSDRYRAVADHVVDTTELDPEAVARRIASA